MLGLFAKKCEYCRGKIEKGREIVRSVKVLGYVGTYPKSFCIEEHANKYVREVESPALPTDKGGGCCGQK